MDSPSLTTILRAQARELGFALVGVCPAGPAPGWERLQAWLAAGFAGEMDYLPQRRDAYQHPRYVLDGVRSLMLLALPYRAADPPAVPLGSGRVSCYAWGQRDYHDVIHERLRALKQVYHEHEPDGQARGVVDTAPLMERDFAARAGLGWIGKNTLLLNKQLGSYFFLAAFLVDRELEYDMPQATDHCGTCRACLEACPTQAFPEPYVLDARKCISYLTIELRGPVPAELREGIGDWVFGCDVCQEVCPWNHKAPMATEPPWQPRSELHPLRLVELFEWSDDDFRRQFRETPLWRARRRGLLRNAAIVLGNQRAAEALGALERGAADADPVVREACAWAVRRVKGEE